MRSSSRQQWQEIVAGGSGRRQYHTRLLPTATATRRTLLIIFLFIIPTLLRAQKIEVTDTVENVVDTVQLDEQRVVGTNQPGNVAPPDTVTIEMVAPNHSPRRAALYSAVLPGLGQIYNRKYWKVPIVYAGFGILGYLIVQYNDQYQLFRRARIAVQNGQVEQNPLGQTQQAQFTREDFLERQVDGARQNRDQTIIYTAAWYATICPSTRSAFGSCFAKELSTTSCYSKIN